MRLLRLPLTGPPLLYEVHSQLAEMLRKTTHMSKKVSRPSKFIANSSLFGNKAGMSE
jgi:hypothetical protein